MEFNKSEILDKSEYYITY